MKDELRFLSEIGDSGDWAVEDVFSKIFSDAHM
jgi:hypothetical protein